MYVIITQHLYSEFHIKQFKLTCFHYICLKCLYTCTCFDYSIMGQVNEDRNEIGIIPRFCEELFSRVDHEVTRDSEMVCYLY